MKKRTLHHFFLPAFINETELWLSRMASDGWVLCDMDNYMFVFEEKKPKNTQYFIYRDFDRSQGIYHDYHTAKQKYHANSKLNSKNLDIFEVDISKIDRDYISYIKLRNKYYRRHYFQLLVMSMIAIGIFAVVLLKHFNFIIILFLFLFFALFTYSTISVIILIFQSKKREKSI